MSKLNAEWHKVHKMPKNPTIEQRMIWHIEHLQNCACRKPSEKLQQEIDQFQFKGCLRQGFGNPKEAYAKATAIQRR